MPQPAGLVVEKNIEFFVKIKYNYFVMLAKPFIKWIGGKSQLLEEIREK